MEQAMSLISVGTYSTNNEEMNSLINGGVFFVVRYDRRLLSAEGNRCGVVARRRDNKIMAQ